MLPFITNLHVHDFCDLLSDVHCAVSLHVNIFYEDKSASTNLPKQERVRLWDNEKRDTFLNNVDSSEIESLSNKLTELKSKQQICQADMDQFVRSMNDFHVDTARLSFGTVHLKQNKHVSHKGPNWFNDKCKTARRKFHLAKRCYRSRKSESNKQNLKFMGTTYKKTLHAELTKFKNKNIRELRGKLKIQNQGNTGNF